MILAGQTDVGTVRKQNEDSFAFRQISDTVAYAIVCDGMGGAKGGQYAGATTCDTVKQIFDEYFATQKPPYNAKDIIRRAIRTANSVVRQKSKEDPSLSGMGTTIVITLIIGNDLFVANVGDSRAYLCNGESIEQISIDHSAVQLLVDSGQISKEEARVHPNKNIITRAIGVDDMVDFDFFTYEFMDGYSALLCSDGLSNELQDEILYRHLTSGGPAQQIADELIQAAKSAGGRDNITAVIIKQED